MYARAAPASVKRHKVRYFWSGAYRTPALTPISTLRYDTHTSRETDRVLAISPYIYQCDLELTPREFIIPATRVWDPSIKTPKTIRARDFREQPVAKRD